MKIVATSDSHSEDLPQVFLDAVKVADLVVHVGDFCRIDTYEQLKSLKDIRAVYGNMDSLELRKVLPKKAVFKCGEVTIGLFHGEGGPNEVLAKVKAAFEKDKVDVVIFGHSHQAFKEEIDGVLYINPGSLTDNIRAEFHSYGLLEINGKDIKASIVKVK